ncbi:hypothetical protein BCR44DRAFT_118903 [Catenaria anguillulae PL171]|uniref:Uncharacterized protein n=1 Tax=Catenaria anguillulae PL171 TaxID=765915 RepID=A0A1Y2I094_9FUNG|nr:hypothetical protein BCR44DRAFT_118903 [Catenaria anguillulae PL171]
MASTSASAVPPSKDRKVNLDRLPLSEELLRYYKDRVEQNEAELQSYIQALDAIKASHEEHHRLTWELQQRADEIRSMQVALSESQAALIEERRQLLKVLAENDELRIQELKDRRKIRYLLGLCGQAVPEDETTYFKPSVHRKVVRSGGGGGGSGARGPDAEEHVGDIPSSEPGLRLKDENQILRLQVQALKSQLEEQQRVHKEAIDRLVADSQIRAREDKLRTDTDAERVRELTEKLSKHQEFLRENTKEVLTIRKNYLMNERLLKEERVRLVDEVNTLRSRYTDLRNKSDQVEKVIEARVLKRHEGLLHELRSQLAKYEQELRRSRVCNLRYDGLPPKDITHSRMSSSCNSYKSLKKRRDYEIEGFTNDIMLLRRQVKELERHIIKTAPLQDAELAVLEMVESTAKRAAKIQKEVNGIKVRVAHLSPARSASMAAYTAALFFPTEQGQRD